MLVVLLNLTFSLTFSACTEADNSKKQKTTSVYRVQKNTENFTRRARRNLRSAILAIGDSRKLLRMCCITGSPEREPLTKVINPATGLPAYPGDNLYSVITDPPPPSYPGVDSHPVMTEDPPPPYTPSPEIIREKLRSLNPELWTRLGLDKLQVLTCDSACQETAQYLAILGAVKQNLATQSDINPLPGLDIELQDISGIGFPLSQLPLQWLQVDEVVKALEAISDRNKRSTLRMLAEALNHARIINHLLYKKYGEVHGPLMQELEKVKSLGVDLNAYREPGQKKNAIAHLVQRDVDCISLRKCLSSGVYHPQECHVAEGVAEGVAECIKSDSSRSMQLRTLMEWLAQQGINGSIVPAGYGGGLLDYAIEHNADSYILTVILDYLGPFSVTLDHLLQIIRASSDPDRKTGSYEILQFAKALARQGHDLAKIETEHGSLVDYTQAYSQSFMSVSFLYELGIPATIEQLVRAIDFSVEALPWEAYSVNIIVQQLQQQNVCLCSWRSEQGESLESYASRVGAPATKINTLAQCVLNCTGHAELTDFPVFQVADAEQYLNTIRQLLQIRGYQIISPPADGQCFFHALSAMLGTDSMTLRVKLIAFLESLISNYQLGSLTDIQNSIVNTVGYDVIQSIYQQLTMGQWGELSYLPVVAAIINAELGEGIYVMTPGTGGQNFTITHFNSGQHNAVSLEAVPGQTPILIHNGSNHWLYAIYHPVTPSTPVNDTFTGHGTTPINLMESQIRLLQL